MSINRTVIEGKWNELKGEIQKAWGKLTDDELEQTKGDATAIKGLIQQRYGAEKADHTERFNRIYDRYSDHKEEAVQSIKDSIKGH